MMLLGYSCIEVGLIHSKNASNLLLMKLMSFFLSALTFYFIGFHLAYGGGHPLIGYKHSWPPEEVISWSYNVSFTTLATSLVTGSVAGRCTLPSFIIYTILISGITFPICVRWSWYQSSFLSRMNFMDFSGSGNIHVFSGVCSLIAAWTIGPRKGRFINGVTNDMPGHSLSLMVFGALILIPCEVGFALDRRRFHFYKVSRKLTATITTVPINIFLTSSSSALLSLFLSRVWITKGFWPLSNTVLSSIAGVAAAGTGVISLRPWEAFIVGLFACMAYFFFHNLLLSVEVDDALDTFATHFGGGVVGLLLTNFLGERGLILSPSLETLWAVVTNIVAVAIITSWAAVSSLLIFGILNLAQILRVKEGVEETGLDLEYHGQLAYDPRSWSTQ